MQPRLLSVRKIANIVFAAAVVVVVVWVVNGIDSIRQMYEKASASCSGLLTLPPELSEWVNHTFKTGGDGTMLSSLDGTASFWQQIGECLLVYAVSQSVCDYILTPKIMGKAMGLNPAIILLALSVWGTLMGLIGMIIALPLTTLLLSYYQTYVINRAPVQPTVPDEPPVA